MIVSVGLHDVDLTGLRPVTICGVRGKHPDSRPEPVTLWDLGCDFDAAVLDSGALVGIDAAGFDGWDDRAIGGVGGSKAVRPDWRGADAIGSEVNDVVFGDKLRVL